MPPIIHPTVLSRRPQAAAPLPVHAPQTGDASPYTIRSTTIRHVLNTLLRRQDQSGQNGQTPVTDPVVGVIIPTTYAGQNTDMAPGAVAGIVLGAILGFLLLCFIITWACSAQQNTFSTADETIEVRDRGAEVREHRRARSPRRRRRSSGYVDDVRGSYDRSRSPRSPRRTQIVEERVIEETIPIPRSRGPSRRPSPGPPPPPPPPQNVNIVLEDRRPRRHSGEEMVEVIEEESDYSTIPSRKRSNRRRSSGGYSRQVDPDRYAGGDYPRRPVRRHDDY